MSVLIARRAAIIVQKCPWYWRDLPLVTYALQVNNVHQELVGR